MLQPSDLRGVEMEKVGIGYNHCQWMEWMRIHQNGWKCARTVQKSKLSLSAKQLS